MPHTIRPARVPTLGGLLDEAVRRRTSLIRRRRPGRRDPVIDVGAALDLTGLELRGDVDAIAYRPFGRNDATVVAIERTGGVTATTPVGAEAFDDGRRALGLPTPPPPVTLAHYVEALWLDRALALTLDADLGRPPRWAELSRAHPLADGCRTDADELRRRTGALPVGWARLRERIAASRLTTSTMDARVARWCDEGAFARRMLAGVAEPTDAGADLDELLDPADAERLRAALATYGGGNSAESASPTSARTVDSSVFQS